jgi:Glycosyl-hydrolase 97 N-terminal
MQKSLFSILFMLAVDHAFAADKKEVSSPDGKINVLVEAKEQVYYSIYYENKALLLPSVINMVLANGIELSGKLVFDKVTIRNNNSIIGSGRWICPTVKKEVVNKPARYKHRGYRYAFFLLLYRLPVQSHR